ncbi:MAG: Uma2 family endonuclease [Caldilineaceae bacterium]|nr:Uma2 family endonuclease [Caldilineaceae bacterium]
MLAQLITRSHSLAELPGDPAAWPVQGAWQYEDYLRLPDDGRRYEIIAGVLYVANAPGYDHQYVVYKLARILGDYVEESQLGVVIGAPFEVHLDGASRPVQPDILFLTHEQALPPDAPYFAGAPTLIVEVISPSSIRLDRQTKFNAYEQAGVLEYWLVNPKVRSVEVYTLSHGEYALVGQFTGEERIESKVFPELAVANQLLYAG